MEDKNLKIPCRECERITNHRIIFSKTQKFPNTLIEPYNYDVQEWQMVQCKGCDNISIYLKKSLSNDDTYIDYIYPLVERKKENRFIHTPAKIQRIYHETIVSFNNLNQTLCVAGIRAIIESICNDKNIKGKKHKRITKCCNTEITYTKSDLETKINILVEKGYITQVNADVLHKLRILGNNAIHQIEIPNFEQIEIAIKIIEKTLDNIYELNEIGKHL